VTENATIAVVDDEDAGRYVKVQTLRRAGFTVLEASTGSAALDLVTQQGPDLLVLDVNLPDISGLEVARRLRASSTQLPAIQILQISNTAVEAADRVRGLEQGADVYLVEPVEGTVLIATVQALLRVRRAEGALAAALERERQAREIAEEANRLKDEFIATLSHELRTPLNALMGWIWQLRNTPLGEVAHAKALDSIERNARIQAQLINDLLDISRAAKGKLPLQIRLMDLRTVVAAGAEFVKASIDSKHLHLDVELEPAIVAGDPARLQQVVTNLLTNAVQFTPREGEVVVRLRVEGSDAVLTVHDNGVGIDPSFLPHVFDQFRQGEGVLSRKHGGLGLGLAVVRQLVDLHGGSVSVASPGAGRGATFTVRLPLETDPRAHGGMVEAPLLLGGVRVLVRHRDAMSASSLASIMQSSGAQVTVAPTSVNRPEPSQEAPYDLIVEEMADPTLVTCRLPAARNGGPASELRARADSPADLVRQLARLIAARRKSAEPSGAPPA
jgi:signal transduction histidine kinase